MNDLLFSSKILGIGIYVPKKVLTNFELSKMIDTSDEWIQRNIGIKQRHIASEDQASSDLSIPAAKEAIKNSNLNVEDIELIIIANQLPDHPSPSTAAIVQGKIGAKNAATFDINCGCQGFVHALAVGSKFINDGTYKNVLVIGTCIHSKLIDWKERTCCVYFGDASGAVVLTRCEIGKGIISIDLGNDGTKSDLLKTPAGGSRMPLTHELLDDRVKRYGGPMNGRAVFESATNIIPYTIKRALKKINKEVKDLDFVITHQANINLIEAGLKKLGLSMDYTFTNLDIYGNTSEASIPLALYYAVKKNKIKKDDLVALTGFGVGFGWGTVLMRWA